MEKPGLKPSSVVAELIPLPQHCPDACGYPWTLRGLKFIARMALALGNSLSCIELGCCLLGVCSCMCVHLWASVCINRTISLPLPPFSEYLYLVCFCQGCHPDLWINISSWFWISDLSEWFLGAHFIFLLYLSFRILWNFIMNLQTEKVSQHILLLVGGITAKPRTTFFVFIINLIHYFEHVKHPTLVRLPLNY